MSLYIFLLHTLTNGCNNRQLLGSQLNGTLPGIDQIGASVSNAFFPLEGFIDDFFLAMHPKYCVKIVPKIHFLKHRDFFKKFEGIILLG
jgi:hypothetical protein